MRWWTVLVLLAAGVRTHAFAVAPQILALSAPISFLKPQLPGSSPIRGAFRYPGGRLLVEGSGASLTSPPALVPRSPALASSPSSSLSDPPSKSGGSQSPLSSFLAKNFFVVGVVGSLVAAYVCPHLFNNGSALRPSLFLNIVGVPTIFLLSSFSLSAEHFLRAFTSLKLNCFTQSISFVLFPLIMLLLSKSLLPLFLPPPLVMGMLILSSLPTTINMCVSLTSLAGGDVPLSITNACVGNFLGLFATPFWIGYFFRRATVASSFNVLGAVAALANKVLLPMLVGQVLRLTALNGLLLRNNKSFPHVSKRVQECVLLSIIFNAFCNTFTPGSNSLNISLQSFATLLFLVPVLHVSVFVFVVRFLSLWGKLRGEQFSPESVVASALCGSHKTLAFGLPLVKTIFGSDPNLSLYSVPILIVHPTQLFLGSLLAHKMLPYAIACQSGPGIDPVKTKQQ